MQLANLYLSPLLGLWVLPTRVKPSSVILTLLSTLSLLSQQALDENMDLLEGITGFEDSVRKCKSLPEPGLPSRGKAEVVAEFWKVALYRLCP